MPRKDAMTPAPSSKPNASIQTARSGVQGWELIYSLLCALPFHGRRVMAFQCGPPLLVGIGGDEPEEEGDPEQGDRMTREN